MPVRVDQAGNHQPAAGIDHFGAGCGRLEAGTDRRDDIAGDQDITFGQITRGRIDGDDIAALDEQFSGHGSTTFR